MVLNGTKCMQFSCQYDTSVSMIKPRICLKLALVESFTPLRKHSKTLNYDSRVVLNVCNFPVSTMLVSL